MNIPEWLKIGIVIILWDIIRFPIQALVTKWFMKDKFKQIHEAVEDVEEAIEEGENNV